MSGKAPEDIPVPGSDPNDSPAEDETDLAAILHQATALGGDSLGTASADLLAAGIAGAGPGADLDKDASSNSKEASSVEGDPLSGALGGVGGPSVTALEVEAALLGATGADGLDAAALGDLASGKSSMGS